MYKYIILFQINNFIKIIPLIFAVTATSIVGASYLAARSSISSCIAARCASPCRAPQNLSFSD